MGHRFKKALKIAATEAYNSEVIDTEMFDLVIGSENEFESKHQWIQDKMDGWLYDGALQDAQKLPF